MEEELKKEIEELQNGLNNFYGDALTVAFGLGVIVTAFDNLLEEEIFKKVRPDGKEAEALCGIRGLLELSTEKLNTAVEKAGKLL